MRLLGAAQLWGSACVLAACGSQVVVVNGEDGTGGATTAPVTATTAATTDAVTSSGSTGTVTTGSDPPADNREGFLGAYHLGPGDGYAHAAFRDVAGGWCNTLAKEDGCEAYACPASAPEVSAGDIFVLVGSDKIVMKPLPDGSYDAAQLTGLQPGQTVQFLVTGSSELPVGFEAEVVLAPPPTTLPPMRGTIDGSQPLPVKWKGGADRYFFGISSQTTAGVGLSCNWAAGDASGVIPASLMQALPKGSAVTYAFSGPLQELVFPGWTVTVLGFTQDTTGIQSIVVK
jgi:hypothetical protein